MTPDLASALGACLLIAVGYGLATAADSARREGDYVRAVIGWTGWFVLWVCAGMVLAPVLVP